MLWTRRSTTEWTVRVRRGEGYCLWRPLGDVMTWKDDPDPGRYYGHVSAKVDEFIKEVTGRFYLPQVYDWVGAIDEKSKGAVRQAIKKQKDRDIIEPYGDRAGCYRKKELAFEVVPLAGLEKEPSLDVRYPFGIERFKETMPKDLDVFAGVPNSGKTALLLAGIVKENMDRWSIYYFSTEMSARNCAMRLSKHDELKVSDWKFNFIENFSNFADVIQPDALNIIDYVETEEPYKIPSILAQIQRRLRKGVAIVALQKNPEVPYAIGGFQTRAKPSLFCTIENNVLTIVKCKNFNGVNPNGFSIGFNIFNGINLRKKGDWTQPQCHRTN